MGVQGELRDKSLALLLKLSPCNRRYSRASWQLFRLVLVIGVSACESNGFHPTNLREQAQPHLETGLQLAQEGSLAGAERELQ